MFIDTKLNFIDLFAGAGGLSEGFIQAGFNPIAHVEMNESAARTLETRAVFLYLKKTNKMRLYYRYERGEITREELFEKIPSEVTKTVINKEMSNKTLKSIFKRVDEIIEEDGIEHIDLIIGGPPCQAYSLVGRAQSSHMNIPMEEDSRNELYKMYTRFLNRYKPPMFVFENVAGLKTANGGDTFRNLQAQLKRVGYEIEWKEQNAKNFGTLQNRRRIIIIGWRKGTNHFYPEFPIINSNALVNDLLCDLPAVQRGHEERVYLPFNQASTYVRRNNIRTRNDVLTHHVVRPNNPRDVEIYRLAIQAWNNGERLKYTDLPADLITHSNKTSFLDRFKVVEGNQHYCHTVLAHLSKDGHYFIHPDINQCRSISVREAARLQTFPDNYYFEGNRGEKFKQIGNAVPPMMAKVIAEELKKQLLID